MQKLNNNWRFIREWTEEFPNDVSSGEEVRLPHSACLVPLHYADKESYSAICGYGRELALGNDISGKRIFLQFDGAAHIAEVYINAEFAAKHYGGYTSFRVDITDFVHPGNNLIAVRLDCTENPEIPPFGYVIDYLTYGGLYRDVWLDIRPETYIEDVFIHTFLTQRRASVQAEIRCKGRPELCIVEITDENGTLVGTAALAPDAFAQKEAEISSSSPESILTPAFFNATAHIDIPEPVLWSPDHPYLYHSRITVSGGGEQDVFETSFGIRTAEFKTDGFYLNGKKLFLRGLNRHQSFPYIGYAATKSLQEEDARILKEELCCNAVRTSHYPQSQDFIDACDRLGLLVFTEIPGWQHIGDEQWKSHALDMLKEMILQYRNHPSVILWGVRINESVDDDAFYTRTNALAHELDPTRPTSGVRYLEKSSLLEDVYAFNDFSHDGTNEGCRKKADITPDPNKPYLISECNGHMYPTKPFDTMAHRQEQALRHARVMNAALKEGDIAGMFGWCMFDYATHEDFGSGDRICYHGVLDSFRNPKLAAGVYASQGDEAPVLEIGSNFDVGEYPAGRKGNIYAFTNADEVRLYKNDRFIKTFSAGEFRHLPHGPILIDDIIGGQLSEEEGFDGKKAKLVKELLLSADRHGFSGMPFRDKLRLLYAHFRYRLSFEDGYALYGKYFGNWGTESVKWKFEAVKNGEVVKTKICTPGRRLHIEASASSSELTEDDSYDMALVRIRILDENGNPATYAQLPLELHAEGAVSVVGPERITAEGGMGGTVLKTTGITGPGTLCIFSEIAGNVTLQFTVHDSSQLFEHFDT